MASSSSQSSSQGSTGSVYAIGGTVTGLSGTGLVLELNGGQALPVATNGAVTFPTPLADGSSYVVTVQSQPSVYREICGVSNGSGTVSGANVSNVAISCSTVVGFLYGVVNNQILSYGISVGTGALVPFGVPVATANAPAGTKVWTTAMVTSPGGAFLYTFNSLTTGNTVTTGTLSNPSVTGTISIFAVDPGSGALTPSGSFTLPDGIQPYRVPGGLAMSSSGFLFVYGDTIQGAPTDLTESWTLSTYAVNASTGALTPTGTTLTVDDDTGFEPTADGKRLYVLTGTSDTPAPVTVTDYAIDPSTGALTAGPTLTTTSSVGYVSSYDSVFAIDPLGRYLYLTSTAEGLLGGLVTTVLPYAVDPASGALTPLAPGPQVASNGGGLITDPSGKYLYMLDSFNCSEVCGSEQNPDVPAAPGSWDGVQALAVDQSSGVVTPIGSQLSVSGMPLWILCDPSGPFVYVGNYGGDGALSASGALLPSTNVAAFTISTDPTTAGQLVSSGIGTLLQPSGGSVGPIAVVE